MFKKTNKKGMIIIKLTIAEAEKPFRLRIKIIYFLRRNRENNFQINLITTKKVKIKTWRLLCVAHIKFFLVFFYAF